MKAPTIDLVNFCNFSCSHCLVNREAPKRAMEKELFSQLIRELKDLGFNYCGITASGELSLHPELDEIFHILVRERMDFEILTNGYLFKEKIFPLIKSPLIRKRIQLVGFSLDSHREEIHDKNRVSGSYERIIEAIGLCKLLGIPFYIKTAVTNINKKDLKNIILFTSGLGAAFQSFIFPEPTKKGLEKGIFPEPQEVYNIFLRLINWIPIFPALKIEGFNPSNDLFSCNAFYKFGVDEWGNYLICNNLNDVGIYPTPYKGKECIGNIKDQPLRELIPIHISMLSDILEWRFRHKEKIRKAPLSLCTWCYFQFGKADEWIKSFPQSSWARWLMQT